MHVRFRTRTAKQTFESELLRKHGYIALNMGNDLMDGTLGFAIWLEKGHYVPHPGSDKHSFVSMNQIAELQTLPTKESFIAYLEGVLSDTSVEVFHNPN